MTSDWRSIPGLSELVPEIITCVDCGGRAHLTTHWDEQPPVAGDLATYRCEDCRDRWDLVIPDPDDPELSDGTRFSDW